MMTDEELLDVVYAWAETPKRKVCGGDWQCPTVDGSYCVDCHSHAFDALVQVRIRLLNGLAAFLGNPQRIVGWLEWKSGRERVRMLDEESVA